MKHFLHFLKKTLIISCLLLIAHLGFSQTATPPSAGDGTASNPYQIASLDNLYWLSQSDTVWDRNFIQTVDIDATSSSSWDGGKGPKPIGNKNVKFTGTYNGKGHAISNIKITRTSWQADNHVGFFGYIGNARIDSLGLINTTVYGYKDFGAFASINEGTISHCYTKGGTVECDWGKLMGGFVGINYSTGIIENCYSNINIYASAGANTESECLGGLVGCNNGLISKCYATGRIYGNEDIGGLAGFNSGTIINCYATGDANGYYANNYGGIAGRNSGTIKYCYSTGDVGYYTYDIGGIVGTTGGTVKYCYYELLEEGGNGNPGTGLTNEQMKDFKNFLNGEWDYYDETYNGTESIWGQNATDNDGYPFLNWQGFSNTSVLSCQEPVAATKKILIENISKNSFELDSITKGGYITDGYVVYLNTEKEWAAPANNSIPAANVAWQNSGQQCIYSGTSQKPEINITNLLPETLYYIQTYSFRVCNGEELYETIGKTDSILTQVDNIQPNGNGTVENPYEIETLANLAWVMLNDTTWSKNFIQTNNINASKSYTWDDSTGFIPIGNATTKFTGTYNGKGFKIDSLYINRPTTNYIGLFGLIDSDSHLDSIGLTNVNFNGKEIIGGLCGYSNGIINSCYTSGNIASHPVENARTGGLVGENRKTIINCYSLVNATAPAGDYVGGLVGRNYGSSAIIKNCYSTGSSNGRYGIGGFAGGNESSATIMNCYSTGVVTGSNSNYKGGFNGYSASNGVINNCFWDKETSTLSTSIGGTGLTTAQMKDYRSFLEDGWDFMDEDYNGSDNIWGHNASENDGYPFLFWQGYTNNFICEAPYSPISEIIIINIETSSFVIDSITSTGYGKIGTAIYINSNDSWAIPADGETPTANNIWQGTGQQCVFIGTDTKPELTVTGLTKDKKYFIKAFAYNECSGATKYEQTGWQTELYTTNEFSQPSGDGSEANPYEIATLENLAWVMYNDTVWDKNFIQTANINAAKTIVWKDSTGFTPIGNSTLSFTGRYNGKGYTIDSLHIIRESEDYIGLFGYTNNSEIDSLGLTNLNIKGNNYVGGIIGYQQNGSVNACYTIGNIQGEITQAYTSGKIGGLIGESNGNVINSYSNTEVKSGVNMTGGLIGWLSTGGIVENSYSKGSVNGNNRVGGLIGDNRGLIKNCYSYSSVSGASEIGGLIGYNSGNVKNSYSLGIISGNSNAGGLIGSQGYYGKVSNSFWDTETSEIQNSVGGTGLTSSQMKEFVTYLKADWDFIDETYIGSDDAWGLNDSENSGYPFLKWQGYTHTATFDCQAPLNPSSNIIFGEIKADSVLIDSIAKGGYITTGYVIYANSENTFVAPTDDSEPTANTIWQNSGQQCVYIGAIQKANTWVSSLSPGTKYYFKVYAYNECSGLKKYEKTGIEAVKTTVPAGEGTLDNPYVIATLDNLEWLMQNQAYWNKHFIQTADIDARSTKNWNEGNGITEIGTSDIPFSGTYNGKGHTIDSLYTKNSYTAFFGYTSTATIIDSLGLTNINFNTSGWTGSIAMYNYGTIRNSFATGTIYAPNADRVGGLVSHNMNNNAKLINCYSRVDITANNYVGGIAGFDNDSYITNCYSTGKITVLGYHSGGLLPYSYFGNIDNSFWDKETSEQNTSQGGTGLLSYQMKNRNSFINASWDFVGESDNGTNDIWGQNCAVNDGYPFLSWQKFDNLCEAPGETVTNIKTSRVSDNSFKFESLTPVPCGTTGYVAYVNNEDTWTNPNDGENPTANTEWQNNGQQCIYNGTAITPNVTITNLTTCDTFYLKVYAYNTCNGVNLFETTGLVQKYGLIDWEAPVPDVTELPEITGQCSVTITSPTATDACEGQIPGGTTDPFEYTEQGTYTVTWIYCDYNGNISTQEQTIIVLDDTNPVISCVENQNKEISADETIYTVNGSEFDPVSITDNCDIDSFYNDINNLATLEGAEFAIGTTPVTWTIVDINGNTSQCSFNVTISRSTTGINNLDEIRVSIYPNPVNSILSISCQKENIHRITVTDITGQVIFEKEVVNQIEGIDFSNYNAGIYFIGLYTDKDIITSKVIKN
ncbi:MAG TPA: GLUG motif-containing protein [Bacteroidales bacterium]|nr:GLUG motif-containing protein [Bacteroidales bacterium]